MRQFTVFLERKGPDPVYSVVEITTDDTASRRGSGLSAAPRAVDIDVDEIECDDIRCPYCDGGDWSFIKCECGMLCCAGGVRESGGNYHHVCPWCGSEAYVEGDIEKVSGKEMADREETPPGGETGSLLPPA